MKVRELIFALQSFNQDLSITLLHNMGQEKIGMSHINTITPAQFQVDANSPKEMFIVIVDESTKKQPEPQKVEEEAEAPVA